MFVSFLQNYDKLESETEKEVLLREFASESLSLKNAADITIGHLSSLCDAPNERKAVAKASVVLCTLNTAGSKSLRNAAKKRNKKFELVILDEAGQCPEAEFYIITTFPGVQRVVVVGDPAQLPATVVNTACEDCGFGESWLKNVLQFRREKVHLLDTQYR